MQREKRYIVLKLKDLRVALEKRSSKVQALFDSVLLSVNRVREERGASPLICVVVEQDWPEYEPTWEAILTRAEKEEKKPRLLYRTSELHEYVLAPDKVEDLIRWQGLEVSEGSLQMEFKKLDLTDSEFEKLKEL